jgi:catechol 1,2-dioxygenase
MDMKARKDELQANPRVLEVVSDVLANLKELIRKHNLTHREYREVVGFFLETAKQGEIPLFMDVFTEWMVIDAAQLGKEGTENTVEGPFYVPDAPLLKPPYVLPQRQDEPGDVLFFSGSVRSTKGNPLAGALLDLWQADADGLYSAFNLPEPRFNLRGRLTTDSDGHFEVRTTVPAPYEIPKFGPTGALLNALGRHAFRPAHLHLKMSHDGFAPLNTQLYFAGDRWLDSDAASAVKGSLITKLEKHSDSTELKTRGFDRPYFTVAYDFTLQPSAA